MADFVPLDIQAPGASAAALALDLQEAAGLTDLPDAETGAHGLIGIKTNLAAPASLKFLALPYVDLKSHQGAVIGGHGGPWAWLQEAILEGQSSNRPVMAGPGEYDFGDEAEEIELGDGNIRIYGQPGHTIFNIDEGTDAHPRSMIKDVAKSATKGFVYLEGLTIKGTFQRGDIRQGAPAIFLDHYDDIQILNCRFMNLSNMATDLHFNERVTFKGNLFQDVSRDGARARESKYTLVDGNVFRRVGDDSVAWHGGIYVPEYDPDDGSPRREGLICVNNFFVDSVSSITCIGGRQITIQNNHANRIGGHGFVFITNEIDEGSHPLGHIDISHNHIYNSYHEDAVIYIRGASPRGTAATSGIVPGQPNASGVFEYIWNHQNADSLVAGDAFPPIENLKITNNTIGRTLPAVAHYSDWGFGYGPPSQTAGDDLAITDAMLRPPAAINVHVGKTTDISGNTIKHVDDVIFLAAQPNVYPVLDGGRVSGNTAYDFTKSFLALVDVGSQYVDLLVDGNNINGDVYRQAAQSNADGTYDSGFGFPRAFTFGNSYGATVVNNRIANVAYVMENPARHHCDNNTIIADIVALGDDAGNKGVRNAPGPEQGFTYVFADCDPTSATYGQIKSVMAKFAGAKPSTGKYVAGWYVTNNAPAIAGSAGAQYVVAGWKRLTTGSGHVLGTDWAEIRTDVYDGAVIYAKGSASGFNIEAPGGVGVFKAGHLAGAVNYAQFYNAATGGNLQMQAAGGDTDIGWDIRTKGTANGNLIADSYGVKVAWSNAGVGFNGKAPSFPTLPAALSTGGAETNANLATAINALRTVLFNVGLGQ